MENNQVRALAVDDELPQLDELAYLLGQDERVSTVATASAAEDALRIVRAGGIDAVFLDIRMPGLDGLEVAACFRELADPPSVVFVTAHDDRAVDAYELGAVDYLLKPIRAYRLAESLRRVIAARSPRAGGADAPVEDEVIPVELGGVTKLVYRSTVRWVEAQGDYARLHTSDGSHLIRTSLSALANRWADAGFVRIHRSYMVSISLISELRTTGSGYVVVVDGTELSVSRRHSRALRERLVGR